MPAPTELERVYDTHAQALYAFLLSFTRNEADTRDLLQELLLKLVQCPALLHGVRETRGFLLRLAHNLAVDLSRRRGARAKRHAQLAHEASALFAPAADPDERAFGDALSGALRDLPVEQRTVVHLKLWEGLTFEEIAEVLELSPNTAASRYRYGLDKLRHALRPIYDELGPIDHEKPTHRSLSP